VLLQARQHDRSRCFPGGVVILLVPHVQERLAVRHRIRVVSRYREDGLDGAESRTRAGAKAIEVVLDFKVELRNVTETPAAID
jgi:hypothetical protein